MTKSIALSWLTSPFNGFNHTVILFVLAWFSLVCFVYFDLVVFIFSFVPSLVKLTVRSFFFVR